MKEIHYSFFNRLKFLVIILHYFPQLVAIAWKMQSNWEIQNWVTW